MKRLREIRVRAIDLERAGVAIVYTYAEDPQEREECRSNAHKIAAVDELLEALRLCYDHCRLYHPEVERNNVGEAVRAALAKAEGKS